MNFNLLDEMKNDINENLKHERKKKELYPKTSKHVNAHDVMKKPRELSQDPKKSIKDAKYHTNYIKTEEEAEGGDFERTTSDNFYQSNSKLNRKKEEADFDGVRVKPHPILSHKEIGNTACSNPSKSTVIVE
jgi:hypothetical protein